ncbi:MAG: sugar kinase [Erysipelothrix sp.]|nr:sugar kinase [Erysipelothrix sp.]
MKVLAFGELMMRLEVPDNKLIHQVNSFNYLFTGTGLNVLAGLSNFGIETRMFTMLPVNNLADAAIKSIKSYGIETDYIERNGHHIGSYILEKGIGYRPSEITYQDRSVSSFNTHLLSKEVIKNALKDISHIHICGIALSTSDVSLNNIVNIIHQAHSLGIKIIFDCNYRPNLTSGKDLLDEYRMILSKADIVLGSKHDVISLLGYESTDDMESLFKTFMNDFKIDIFAGTHKDSTNYKGFLVKDNTYYTSKSYDIKQVLDPIGTGDGFAARLIAGILNQEDNKILVNKAAISGVLAHTLYGDVVSVTEDMIDHILEKEETRIRR